MPTIKAILTRNGNDIDITVKYRAFQEKGMLVYELEEVKNFNHSIIDNLSDQEEAQIFSQIWQPLKNIKRDLAEAYLKTEIVRSN